MTNEFRSVYEKVAVDESVVELAELRCADMFDRFDKVSVSFSGGKDSTCVLMMTLAEAEKRGRPIDVLFWDEEAIPYQTEDYVRRVKAEVERRAPGSTFRWLCIPIKHRNACSNREPWWYPWDPRCPEKWCRPLPPEAITELPRGFIEWETDIPQSNLLLHPGEQNVAQALGIRAEESLMRQLAVTRRRYDNHIIHIGNGISKVYPVFDWRQGDVWLAPKEFGWDYNRAYDVFAAAGISIDAQRLGPPFGEEPANLLWTWGVCFPEVWDKLQGRVAGSATAARLFHSALYHRSAASVRLPEGWTWLELLRYELDKQSAEVKPDLLRRIDQAVRKHYKLTNDPILDAPHPLTGISWPYLVAFAQRGNTKGRMLASAEATSSRSKRYPGRLEEWRRPDSPLRLQVG